MGHFYSQHCWFWKASWKHFVPSAIGCNCHGLDLVTVQHGYQTEKLEPIQCQCCYGNNGDLSALPQDPSRLHGCPWSANKEGRGRLNLFAAWSCSFIWVAVRFSELSYLLVNVVKWPEGATSILRDSLLNKWILLVSLYPIMQIVMLFFVNFQSRLGSVYSRAGKRDHKHYKGTRLCYTVNGKQEPI